MIWLILTFSLCFGLQQGKIPLLSRIPLDNWWGDMLACSYCTGFHTGWISYVILYGFVPGIMVAAFCSAILCYVFDVLLQWVESRIQLPRS